MTFSEIAASYRRAAMRSFIVSLARRNLTPETQREVIAQYLAQVKVAEDDAAWFDPAAKGEDA